MQSFNSVNDNTFVMKPETSALPQCTCILIFPLFSAHREWTACSWVLLTARASQSRDHTEPHRLGNMEDPWNIWWVPFFLPLPCSFLMFWDLQNGTSVECHYSLLCRRACNLRDMFPVLQNQGLWSDFREYWFHSDESAQFKHANSNFL